MHALTTQTLFQQHYHVSRRPTTFIMTLQRGAHRCGVIGKLVVGSDVLVYVVAAGRIDVGLRDCHIKK
jgi:hypothetical protein